MPRQTSSASAFHDVLSLLSPERRAEIMHEVIGSTVHGLVTGAKNFGHLVERLTGHARWGALQHLPIGSIFHASGDAPKAKTGPGRPPKATRPAPKPTTKAAPKAAPTPPAPAGRRDALLQFIADHPGLRSEEIVQQTGGNNESVKTRLAELFAQGLVKRAGKARGTRYTASSGSKAAAPATAARNPAPASTPKAAKAAKPAKSTGQRGAAFMRPVQPDAALGKVVGAAPLPRPELTKRLWAYIKKNGLQDAKERRMINADDALRVVFGGKKQVSMFEMTKLVSHHLA